MNPPYPPNYGLNSTTTVLLEGCLLNNLQKVDMPLNKETNQGIVKLCANYLYIVICLKQRNFLLLDGFANYLYYTGYIEAIKGCKIINI